MPIGHPINCINTTFLPLNVTLVWTEPALIDQNGASIGYNLTCMNTNGVLVRPSQLSMKAMYTITDLDPFNSYTCDLSFVNILGQGPPTKCTFTTAQDSKDM